MERITAFTGTVRLAAAESNTRSVEIPLVDPEEMVSRTQVKDGVVYVYFRLIGDEHDFVRRTERVPVPQGFAFSYVGYNYQGTAAVVYFYKEVVDPDYRLRAAGTPSSLGI